MLHHAESLMGSACNRSRDAFSRKLMNKTLSHARHSEIKKQYTTVVQNIIPETSWDRTIGGRTFVEFPQRGKFGSLRTLIPFVSVSRPCVFGPRVQTSKTHLS